MCFKYAPYANKFLVPQIYKMNLRLHHCTHKSNNRKKISQEMGNSRLGVRTTWSFRGEDASKPRHQMIMPSRRFGGIYGKHKSQPKSAILDGKLFTMAFACVNIFLEGDVMLKGHVLCVKKKMKRFFMRWFCAPKQRLCGNFQGD